ncbi:hypothetical protein [Paenibacillus tianjinensis]|uniref:Uncharacterized protein n=1 Tax=Paenibacillus tianjinensis TaxID=2810347 RepID=A0ABX7L5U7_9BACL|nr:hypothetical protein [Paenibacillus tianjinensis]QSF43500.1 hypothetical protein JRJ22_19755 [Paenibacillus tianjinensis]
MTTAILTQVKKVTPIETLIKRASRAVSAATCGDIKCNEYTSAELRRVFLELAEDGAWAAYQGNGMFEDGYNEMHIDEMSDRWIARKLIYEFECE